MLDDPVVWHIRSEQEMEALAGALAQVSPPGSYYYLHGNLGVGKTVFCRGFLRALGYSGTVKSPTYTIVERYHPGERAIYHFDLYRLGDAEELLYLGVDDYFDGRSICLVEWAENGYGYLPQASIDWHFQWHDSSERRVMASPKNNDAARILLQMLQGHGPHPASGYVD